MRKARDNARSLLKRLFLSDFTVDGNIFLAPMAGWTDAAFRRICLEWGAYLAYTEMVSAEAITRQNAKTWALLQRADEQERLCVQIFASSESIAGKAVQLIERFNPSLIDLNCGCSIPKILKSGCGAALLRSPHKIGSIVRAMRAETDAPVSVKLRSGWDSSTINYAATAEEAQKAGASLVCLHPRTRTQSFGGKSEWLHLRELKRRLDIPVLGSGDLFTAEDAKQMLLQTECDGVMIARGAMGNPFIFSEANQLLKQRKLPEPPTPHQRLMTALKQLEIAISIKGEPVACREMRKHFCAYSKGIAGSTSLRKLITRTSQYREYEGIVHEFLEDYVRTEA